MMWLKEHSGGTVVGHNWGDGRCVGIAFEKDGTTRVRLTKDDECFYDESMPLEELLELVLEKLP